jgi:hypothetical protein
VSSFGYGFCSDKINLLEKFFRQNETTPEAPKTTDIIKKTILQREGPTTIALKNKMTPVNAVNSCMSVSELIQEKNASRLRAFIIELSIFYIALEISINLPVLHRKVNYFSEI